MKKLTTNIVFVLFVVLQVTAQKNNIFTKSVHITEFIPFVVNNYPVAVDSLKTKNITFLIPTNGSNDVTENLILLKQGFRMLSNRLSDNDHITIVAYADSNGEVLKTSAKDIKTILYVLNDMEKSISVKVEDGIQLAYDTAELNFDKNAVNTIVMVRNSNVSSKPLKKIKAKNENRPRRSNAILLTLISLAPEVIRILKE